MSSSSVAAATGETASGWRTPGAILLVSSYELGHQPLAVASPRAFLEHAGYRPSGLDIAVTPFDAGHVRRARFVGMSVPMHTALRLGVRAAERIRALNPACHIAFYGMYAHLNADYLLEHVADSVLGGECEAALVSLVQALEAGGTGPVEGVAQRPPRSWERPDVVEDDFRRFCRRHGRRRHRASARSRSCGAFTLRNSSSGSPKAFTWARERIPTLTSAWKEIAAKSAPP